MTAGEALAYARETLGMLVQGRNQEPTHNAGSAELLGLPLGGGSESGPDRVALRRELFGGDVVARKAPRGARSRRTIGIALAGVGVAGIVGSTVPASADVPVGDQPGLLGANVVAWTAAGVGSALVVTSLQHTPRPPRRVVGGVLAGVGLALAIGTEVALANAAPPPDAMIAADANAAGWGLATVGAGLFATTFFGRKDAP